MMRVYPRFNSQCRHTIRIVEDEEFERPKGGHPFIWTLDVNLGEWEKKIIIQPHFGENEHNTELFKLKLYCERNNIKVIAKGRLNQLPMLSQIADRVILDEYSNMQSIYITTSHYKSRGRKIPGNGIDEWKEKFSKVSDEDVVERFKSTTLCIRRSSYEFFMKSNLPKDITIAEVRLLNKQQKHHIQNHAPMEVTGLNYEFQIPLVQKAGHHYMSVQVLGSLINHWSFLCGGGSANLLCLLPVNWLLLSECGKMFRPSTRNIMRLMAQKRYGSELGRHAPVIDTSTKWTKPLYLDGLQWKHLDYARKCIRQKFDLIKNSRFHSRP